MNMSHYRVAASCFEPEATHSMERRRQALRAHLAKLLETQRPDLLVLPELAAAHGAGEQERWGAEPVDGPTIKLASELAAERGVNICMPILEESEGALHNSAVYLDRAGQVVGKYRKRVLTPGEVERGIRPGATSQPPVVIDGLRVGTAICFDGNFPDLLWDWIAAGVDLLLFPAYTYAGGLMRNWAVNCGVPLVCAFPWESTVYDRDGNLLAEAGVQTDTVRFGFHPPWVACDLNFRSRVYHLDDNQLQLGELAARFGAQVDVRLMVRDGRMMLTTRGEGIELDWLEREFGLVPLQEYLRASRALCQ